MVRDERARPAPLEIKGCGTCRFLASLRLTIFIFALNRVPRGLGLAEDGVEVGGHFGRVPILGADDFAGDLAVAIDDVGFRVHHGAVIESRFLGRVAGGWVVNAVILEEFAVGGLVFIDADAENNAITRGDALLKLDERGRFLNARRAPSGPEIQDHNFAAVIGEFGGLAGAQGQGDFFGGFAGDGGFALAVVGESKEGQDEKSKAHAAPSQDSPDEHIHIK